MKTHITPHRPGAIAAGLLCAAGAAAVLLEDVASHGLTVEHGLSVVVLVGTIAAGHLALGEARALRLVRALALVALALIGSSWCVLATAGRTAEHAASARAEVDAANRRIVEAGAQLATARERLAAATAEVTRECRSGFKAKCQGWQRTEAERQARVDQLVAEIGRLGAVQVGDQRARNVGEIVSGVTGLDAARIERAAALLLPFVPALFLELGAMLFLWIGIGHRAGGHGVDGCASRRQPAQARAAVATTAGTPRLALVPPSAHAPLLAALDAAAGRTLTNGELAAAMLVTKGEASKRAQAAETAGLVTRSRTGREVRVARA